MSYVAFGLIALKQCILMQPKRAVLGSWFVHELPGSIAKAEVTAISQAFVNGIFKGKSLTGDSEHSDNPVISALGKWRQEDQEFTCIMSSRPVWAT